MCDDDAPGADDGPTMINPADADLMAHRANCLQWAIDLAKHSKLKRTDSADPKQVTIVDVIGMAKEFADFVIEGKAP